MGLCGLQDLFEFPHESFTKTNFLIKSFSFKTIVLANVGRRNGAGNLSQNIPNQDNFYLNSTDLPSSYMCQILASTQRRGSGIVVITSNAMLESS